MLAPFTFSRRAKIDGIAALLNRFPCRPAVQEVAPQVVLDIISFTSAIYLSLL